MFLELWTIDKRRKPFTYLTIRGLLPKTLITFRCSTGRHYVIHIHLPGNLQHQKKKPIFMAWATELVNRVHISFMVAGHTDHLLPLYGGGGLSVVKSTHWTAQVVTKVLEQCFRGQWKGSLLHTVDPTVLGTPSRDYKDACTQIKDKKFANMVTMYDKFISPDRL